MSLDPIVKALLEQMQAQPMPPMWQMEPAMARASFAASVALIAAPEPIGRSEDLDIPTAGGSIRARLYTPLGEDAAALPLLIYYHGGGWVIGDLDSHDGMCRILANESGARVLAVDYRLAPEHKFPAAVDDALAALHFARADAAKLGIDAGRIAVGGDSAGGCLAAVVAQQAAQQGHQLAYQLLLFPVTQIGEETPSLVENGEGYFLEAATLKWFYDHYLPAGADHGDPRISPLFAADLSGLPPAYVMLAGYDPLHDEGLGYAEKLQDAGVAVTIDDHPDMVHVFVYFTAILPQARAALAKAAQALKAALTPG